MEVIARGDLDFLLYHWLRADELGALGKFRGQGKADWTAFLDLAEKLAIQEFLPCYKIADRDEPRLQQDASVKVQKDLAEAVRAYLSAGLHLASVDEAHGGMQLPFLMTTAAMAQIMAANIAGSGFLMLSIANARVICDFGTPRQVELFAGPQHAGRSLGTMCLSEPDVGSSLGDITTRAVADGTDAIGERYRIFGRKMWISAGDQDVTETTMHLVLAKVADAEGRLPAGTKGISLFIVPKHLPDELPGNNRRNDVEVAGLNHKMGYRGTPNCMLNFGEGARHRPLGEAGAIGYLIGAAGQGLPIMFQMMNEARINVGLGAAALAYRGYLLACAYAAERVQGRALEDKKAPRPVPILRHPDVKRMLLAQKVIAEGSLALCLYSARLCDLAGAAEDPERRVWAQSLLDILTPVTKSWPSEQGLLANHLAIQIHGGYGYTRDFDVEQIYRDNRLNPIHEGTTGIQAIDLLGRKILNDGLKSFGLLMGEMRAAANAARALPELAGMCDELDAARLAVEGTVQGFATEADAPSALAEATPFLDAFGHLVIAWLWLDMARVALSFAHAPATPGVDPDLVAGKLWACRYFYAVEVPKIRAFLAPIASRAGIFRAVPEAVFRHA
ncbi:acyl-CoA dehydrogenase [Xanthobacter sp. AM11]|uniref:acyl-CoA dehydrogenase n=1 Tax=Xanthobacter sp. AM11 TaxID=3380643 RepID=UPI0039BF14B7